MNRPDLTVCITGISPSELRGRVVGDAAGNAWIRAGADVTLFVNAAGTAFDSPDIRGSGRIYDDRIEIDLILPPHDVSALTTWLEGDAAPTLGLLTSPITETLFRVEEVRQG